MISTGQVNLSNKFSKSSSIKAFYIPNTFTLSNARLSALEVEYTVFESS